MSGLARSFGVVLVLIVSGCEGVIAAPGASSDPGADTLPVVCDGTIHVPEASLRRLTPEQYLNTVRDLLGDPEATVDLDADTGEAVTRLGAEKLHAAAEILAERAMTRPLSFIPCDVASEGSAACASTFIAAFGTRAFRRPVRAEEQAWLEGVYAQARTSSSFAGSIRATLEVMLQSPQFVYLHEEGLPGPVLAGGVRALTSFERAARLSLLLWRAGPDQELSRAAAAGELDHLEGVRTQATRLLQDPRARATVLGFFTEWLELDGTATHHSIDSAPKSPTRFPNDSRALRAAMRAEVEALVTSVVLDGRGSYSDLLESRRAYVSGALASLYGLEGSPETDPARWVDLPASERSGLFTRAAFLAVHSGPDVQSPIRRGAFLVRRAMCIELGDPPPDVSDTPVVGGTVENEDGMTIRRTVRQDVEARTYQGSCAGCHRRLNPIGFAFENYDALGSWQTEELQRNPDGSEYRLPIDARGDLPATDVAGPLDGGVELSARLARSRQAHDCFATRWFEWVFGRPEAREDRCSVEAIEQRFAQTDSITDLILAVVESDAFLYMRPAQSP